MSRPVVEITPPRAGDAAELAANLRQQDIDELKAAGDRDPLASIEEASGNSRLAWTARVDGKLACMFGARGYTLLGATGVPWMLGTDELLRHRRALVRLTPRYIGAMLAAYPRLVNAVHDRNTVSKEWLRRLGFTIYAPQPVPPHGELFSVFEMRK